jgi:uncharacterized membrane protein
MRLSRRSLLHGTFEIGITLKCIDGVVQVLSGLLLLLFTPESLQSWIQTAFQHVFGLGPHGRLASELLKTALDFAGSARLFAGVYLISHGVIKIGIVTALWMNKLWAYPLAILVFAGFIVYQAYRYSFTHSGWLIWLSVFDAAVVWLTWREYQAQKPARPAPEAV